MRNRLILMRDKKNGDVPLVEQLLTEDEMDEDMLDSILAGDKVFV
jgi:hypothetical protein